MKRKIFSLFLALIVCLGIFSMTSCDLSIGELSNSHRHSYEDWQVGFEATCTSIGYSTRTCKDCKYIDYAFQNPKGHFYDRSVMSAGEPLYICSICGNASFEVEASSPSSPSSPSSYSEGLEYGLTEDNDHYRVEGIGTCTDVNIVIPDEYEGKPVTEIGEKAFYEIKTIISITIPESVLKIGDKAFSKCENLIEVKMSDDIDLGLDVFRGSINVEISIVHDLVHVPAKKSSCTEAGNIEHYYCETCNEYYKDANGEERIYEISVAPSHKFSSGVCTKCGTVKDEISIVNVSSIGYLGKFALGTLEDSIGLPSAISVTTADGRSHTLAIDWNMHGYVKNTVGVYTIVGYIQLGSFHMSDGMSNRVEATVEIVDYMEGTADIVFILDISGSMGDEIANVKNNIITFAQAIEDRGVSARWSAITYSDYTEYSSSTIEEQTQIIKNGAENWFVNVENYKTAISNIRLANGGDYPEVAIDGLMLANTLKHRTDARVFYIILTDATYKTANHYDVESMSEVVEILNSKGVNVSVITSSEEYVNYSELDQTTGGIFSSITGNFSNDLLESLVPIIYTEVIE